jgi:hypothetical protein
MADAFAESKYAVFSTNARCSESPQEVRNKQTRDKPTLLEAEALQKLSKARWPQFQHEFEKRRWPSWRRLLHRLKRCPICAP